MKHFTFYSKGDILSLTRVRRFETRLGERVQYVKDGGEWPEVIQQSPAKYVLLGIPEDIGVKANYGIGGADTSWLPFLSAFLNVKSNDFFTGENILLLGHFDFGDLKFLIENNAYTPDEMIDAYRHAINVIDDEVENILKIIAAAGKIPIVIGGGHNNCYPIIKGVAKGLYKADRIHWRRSTASTWMHTRITALRKEGIAATDSGTPGKTVTWGSIASWDCTRTIFHKMY